MKNPGPEIICCGHAAFDLNFLIKGFPLEDRKYKADGLIQTGGGPAANAACLTAQWGAGTAFAGLLGDDPFGRLILSELSDFGVDTSLTLIEEHCATPISTVLVNTANGSRTLINHRNEGEQPAVNAEIIEKLRSMKPSVLHFDGHAPELSHTMIDMFPDASIVVDAGTFRKQTDRLCTAADYTVCSRSFAEVCSGIDDIISGDGRRRCIEVMQKRYSGRVIVTLGENGIFYGNKDGKLVSLDAFRVEAVDSTGAGDIFHGAFSFGLLEGYPLEKNIRLAAAAAALSVTKPGGRTYIPGLEESLRLAGFDS